MRQPTAGLETYLSAEERLNEKPDCVDLSESEWKNLDKRFRHGLYKTAKIAEIKMESGCEECGFDEDYRALDFHHEEQNKNFDISWGTLSLNKVKKEIEKCKVLCANCHRKVGDKTYPIKFN